MVATSPLNSVGPRSFSSLMAPVVVVGSGGRLIFRSGERFFAEFENCYNPDGGSAEERPWSAVWLYFTRFVKYDRSCGRSQRQRSEAPR